MEPTSFIDDAEFCLPLEFLTDDDFLFEKENKDGGIDDSNWCLPSYEPSLGFGVNSSVKPKSHEDDFLDDLTRQMVQSSLEDDFSGGFCGNHMACGATRSPQSTLCGNEIGCGCRYQNCQSRVSSQTAWDLYCAAAEEVAKMNISNEPYNIRKHSVSASKNPNNGYYNNQSLQYQKLQAIQFQQLKQQQLLKQHRQMVQQSRRTIVDSNKNGGPPGLSSSAWSNQFPRIDNSGMRAVFLGGHTKKRSSTGTGVFLPRRIDHNSSATGETREKTHISTVLVPARVAQVLNLNLDESVVKPVVQSSGNLNDVSWRQRSSVHGGVKAEQPVNEHRLPSDWTY